MTFREVRLRMRSERSKAGAPLGRKGIETRARLLEKTRELLEHVSPFNLTVAAITKAARTAAATFYVYFNDVQDVFYALSLDANREFEEMAGGHREWFAEPCNFVSDAQQFVDEFNAIWDRHRHALQYCNLESDRGNARFQDLRTANALPLIDRLAQAGKRANPAEKARDAYADAIVLLCSVERLAATRHQYPADRPHLPPDELSRAQARVIAQYLMSTANGP